MTQPELQISVMGGFPDDYSRGYRYVLAPYVTLIWPTGAASVEYPMPRIFDESRWLQKLRDPIFNFHVFSLCRDVWANREVMPYPDVIRARILMLALAPVTGSVENAIEFASKLEVKHGALWNYFTRNVTGWTERMELRLGRNVKSDGRLSKRMRLTQDDLRWIADYLKNKCTAKSLKHKLKGLHMAAELDPKYGHLASLPRSTLWDHQRDIEIMGEFITKEREKCKRKQPRTSSPVQKRDTMASLSEQDDMEPDAVVVPFGNHSTCDTANPVEGVTEWTGNPF